MEKKISKREFATIKRVAQCVSPMVQKKEKIQQQIADLNNELILLNTQISGFEQGIKALCCGLSSEDIVHREITPLEGKFDKEGRQLKKVSFEPNNNVRFEDGFYYVTLPEAPEETKEETTEETPVEETGTTEE